MGRQKSFYQNFTWIWLMLLFMGVIFLGIGLAVQFAAMSPDNMSVQVNGMYQQATDAHVRQFKLIFLLAFGLVGLILTVIGLVVLLRTGGQKRQARRLKQEGVKIRAVVTDYEASAVNINYRQMVRLHCSYTASDNRTYVFKSNMLRKDPVPYLTDGLVDVYYDRSDMSTYFVDVDGSVGLGTRLIEL